jgi:dihydrofolate reductase
LGGVAFVQDKLLLPGYDVDVQAKQQKEIQMRRLTAGLFISLDGVIDSVDQWSMEYFDDGVMEEIDAQTSQQDAMLMGRVTYQMWADYWPSSTDEPFATYINNVRKYVVSSTLDKVVWNNSTLLKGDLTEEVTELKQQPGRNIGMGASPTLIEALLERDLLDELMLVVHPVVVGHGRRLFQGGGAKKPLKLVKSRITDKGVAVLVYEPDRN